MLTDTVIPKRSERIRLDRTYARESIHCAWDAVYRENPLQHKFDDLILDRVLARTSPPPDALFLDAGCGPGHHALRIAGKGYRCVGLDISETMLQRARAGAGRSGLDGRLHFVRAALEDLELESQSFDIVHCRGVLMHIPNWEQALAHLCRVLRPGGKIVIMEANTSSMDTRLRWMTRPLRKARGKMVRSDAGIEFWTTMDGQPFLFRIADLGYLTAALQQLGIGKVTRFATEFWDINQFPHGLLRNAAIRFNRFWFTCRLPARFSAGVALVGEKTKTPAPHA
ncbi:MAG: class I SAM-dependent methyltransferase [Sedimentisphaerales bacterium]|nr:class I SAM-dependent methyltransferase [Sedimentisphaerales bacterium]